ncbi:MAG: glycosyltransferase [Alistipes sp.]|nr:glycosyltransferase [Alistipes sp.]
MKILTIISKLDMGGIEKTFLSCVPALQAAGFELEILCRCGGVLDKDFENLGVRLIDLGRYRNPISQALFIARLINKEKYNIVHTRGGHSAGFVSLVGYMTNTPVIVSLHNQRPMFKNTWEKRPLLSALRSFYLKLHKFLTNKFAYKIVGHSRTNLSYFSSEQVSAPEKYTVLYNGVDFSKLDGDRQLSCEEEENLKAFIKDAGKVIIHIGSFKEQKNHSFLIDVFAALAPKVNNYKLILLGTGSLYKDIYNKVHELGLENYVYFAGMQKTIAPYLKVADVFFFPSIYEGFGNVLIEAQYMGVPVCASNIGPHIEASSPMYHSIFFDPQDRNDAVEKMKIILSNGPQEDKIEDAKKFAESFSINNMVEGLTGLYHEAMSR